MRFLRIGALLTTGILFIITTVLSVLIAVCAHTGYRFVVIVSGSMEPTYHVGSALLLKTLAATEVHPGLPVTFQSVEGTLTTHRVISEHTISGTRYIQTKGDANPTPDPDFSPIGAVIGTPVAHLPFAGYTASFLLSPAGRLLVYGPPLVVLLMLEVRRIRYHFAHRRTVATVDPPGSLSVSRWGPVPVILAVIAVSAAAGVMLGHSNALYTSATNNQYTMATATLDPPTNGQGARHGSITTLTWSASGSAFVTGYDIYRSVGHSTTDFALLASVPATQTTYSDSTGSSYSLYEIRSIDAAWTSVFTAPITAK